MARGLGRRGLGQLLSLSQLLVAPPSVGIFSPFCRVMQGLTVARSPHRGPQYTVCPQDLTASL